MQECTGKGTQIEKACTFPVTGIMYHLKEHSITPMTSLTKIYNLSLIMRNQQILQTEGHSRKSLPAILKHVNIMQIKDR